MAETHARILEEIRRQPGVQCAGGSNFLPLESAGAIRSASTASRRRRGRRMCRRRRCTASAKAISRRWARRWPPAARSTAFDNPASAAVVIVNESLRGALSCRRTRWAASSRSCGDGHRPARLEPDAHASAAGAGAPPLPHLPPTRYEIVGVVQGRPQRAARPGGRAGHLLHDAPVPVPELFLAVRATRSQHGAGRRAQGAAQVAPERADGAPRRRGARSSRRGPPRRGC